MVAIVLPVFCALIFMPALKTPYVTPKCMTLMFDPQGDEAKPWIVKGDHKFVNGTFAVVVEDGFRTDLASVPAWLLWLISPFGNHQRAALFHDGAYRQQECSRFTADAIFRAIMERDGVPAWKAALMFYVVRIFGARAWNENRKLLEARDA